jgi:tetratricopeptide (TPR) repeat protein
LGKVLLAQKSTEEAISHLQKAIDLKPSLGEAHYQLSLAEARTGRSQEAADELKLSQKLIANQNRVQIANQTISRAEDESGHGQAEKAITDYKEAIRLEPYWANAHEALGDVLRQRGDLDQATAEFRRALELEPEYYDASLNLARTFLAKSQYDDAVEKFQDALRLRPSSAEAYNYLGLALAGKGDFDKAVQAFKEALRIDPHYQEAQQNLSSVLRQSAPAPGKGNPGG